ncbi:hypothetical protein KUW00_16065 [Halomonas sp. DP5N14-9]|nr:hypothetical protein [Halomonas sp. DP5N14-9]
MIYIQAYHCDRLLRLSALTNQNGDRWQFRYDGGGWLIADTGFDGRTCRSPTSLARPLALLVCPNTTTPLHGAALLIHL